MKMSDRRKDLRPREKLQARGAGALSDYELLMAIIGSGNAQADVSKIARDVQKLIKEQGSELTYEDLLTVKSLGPAKASSVCRVATAALESASSPAASIAASAACRRLA